LRAFPILSAVPVGHTVAYIGDDRHAPHLQPGEFAVVDTSERGIEFGELYLIHQSRGPVLWQIGSDHRPEGRDRPCAYLHPLNMPWRRVDGSLDMTGPLHVSDGPIYLDALGELVIGRVVAILDGSPVPKPRSHRIDEARR
jgi:hypothetical protein